MRLVVGLGNPGRQYEKTRHNVGFMAVDKLAGELNAPVSKLMFQALVGQAGLKGEKIILAKPLTYMNLSGNAVGSLMRWYKISPSDLIVIYDDMDLPLGSLRIRKKGGDGGHNGMKSIIENIGTKEFPRIRIGIGKPVGPGPNTVDWVLGRFSTGEAEEVEKTVENVSRAVMAALCEGLDAAMNKFNSKA